MYIHTGRQPVALADGDESTWKLKQLPKSRARDIWPLLMHSDKEDAIRFIRSYDTGSGDYTKERKKYLRKKTVKQIANEILELQKSL
jgi:hypothetical protein